MFLTKPRFAVGGKKGDAALVTGTAELHPCHKCATSFGRSRKTRKIGEGKHLVNI